jgi:hypothetical protein
MSASNQSQISTLQSPPDNEKDFPTWVRNWIHYDTLTSNLSKQATNARKVRDEFEGKIIENLERRKMTNVVLQVQQGKYQITKETHSNGLTFSNIEKLLHQYFRVRGAGPSSDETDQIMAFIRQNRGQTVAQKLKKIG